MMLLFVRESGDGRHCLDILTSNGRMGREFCFDTYLPLPPLERLHLRLNDFMKMDEYLDLFVVLHYILNIYIYNQE